MHLSLSKHQYNIVWCTLIALFLSSCVKAEADDVLLAGMSEQEPIETSNETVYSKGVNEERKIAIDGELFIEIMSNGVEVKILNIDQKSIQGLELAPGKYNIEIAKEEKHKSANTQSGKKLSVKFSKALSTQVKTNKAGMEFAYIPPGKFIMGSPISELLRHDSEVQHEVTLTKGFHMGKTEVTVEQWRVFVDETGYKTEAEVDGGAYRWTDGKWELIPGTYWDKPGFPQSNKHPVTCVSWNDAQKFIQWLNGQKEGRYRLPTEAEWEYACRSGSSSALFWGEDTDVFWKEEFRACQHANVADISVRKKYPNWTAWNCDDGYVYTAPVAQYFPNSFGLYDMIGNVWEWCQDWYANIPKDPVIDPKGALDGSKRVNRGGGWMNGVSDTRCAARDGNVPDARSISIGFRVLWEKNKVP